MSVDTGLLYPKCAETSTSNMTGQFSGNITCNMTGHTPSNIESNTESNIALAPSAFFSKIPTDQILILAGARRLKRPDAMLLLALLAHKRQPDVSEVRPSQSRLAKLLACAVRTVQRGLDRLEAAGLIAKCYIRDRLGRVHGLRYDLAAVLALLAPSKATKVSSGGPARTRGAIALVCEEKAGPGADLPKRQKCHAESDSDAAEINSSAPEVESPPVSPAVAALANAGMIRRVAVMLAAKVGEDRCRLALEAMARRHGVKNKPAWLFRCLSENWDLGTDNAAARLPSHCRYVPPAAPSRRLARAADAPDPLDALPSSDLARLEAAARAELIAELPALRPLLERGRRTPPITLRMRALLPAAGGGVGEGT